jgi:hypothetical protein
MNTIRIVGIWLALFIITILKAKGQLIINEYSCGNINIVTDNYGDREDWVELYNTGSVAVDLTGFCLSDRANNPTKWPFPTGSIAPNGFVRIWTSGRNIVVGNNYHASFKLNQTENEKIILATTAGLIVDSLTLKRHQANHSWGRTTDGSNSWSIFTTPTVNTTNNTSTPYTRYAAMPTFSQNAGYYANTVTVSVSTTESNSTIYYTTNGFVPTTASSVYSSALTFNSTTVLKAYVVSTDPNVLPSFYEFSTYFINEGPFTVPVYSIHGDQVQSLLDGNASLNPVTALEYFETDQQLKLKTVGRTDKHGNDSWAYDQRGIDFSAWDQYGYNHFMKYKIFPRTNRQKFQRIMFKAGASDSYPGSGWLPSCHLRDAFVQDYAQKIGLDFDCRSLKHNILFVNGQYWGFYETREKVDDKDYTDYYYNQDGFNIDVLKYWGGLQVDYGSDTGWVNLYNYVMANNMTDPIAYNSVKSRLDFSSLIDNCIYNTYIVNSDWINWNTMWWRGRNPDGDKRKWRYCGWDMDNVFNLGQNYSGWQTTGPTADPCDLQNNWPNAGPNMGHLNILSRLLQNTEFKEMYVNRYADLINGYLSCDSTLAHLDWFLNIMTPEMPKQIQRWGGSMATWNNNVQTLKNFINDRCSFIAGSLVDCYQVTGPYQLTVKINPPGSGTVSIGTFTPQIYPYTGTYFGDINVKLQANPVTDYVFGYWIPNNNAVTPTFLSDTIKMNLSIPDTITAQFKYWPSIINSVTALPEFTTSIFPTLTNNNLIIDYKGNVLYNNISCKIYSITGMMVADLSHSFSNASENRIIINLRDLNIAQGMYFVELSNGERRETTKIIYQND